MTGSTTCIRVPISVAMRRRGTDRVEEVLLKARSRDTVEAVRLTVERIFEARYGPDAVWIWTQQSMLEEVQESTRTMTLMLGAIAGVSLAGRGHRRDEHHAGGGYRAHERNRAAGKPWVRGSPRYCCSSCLSRPSCAALGGIAGVLAGIGGSRLVARLGPETAVSPASRSA
ncbi:MAG: hypothetical protein ACOX35_04065 [Bacillota bacterium]